MSSQIIHLQNNHKLVGLTKKATCLRGLEALRPRSRTAKIKFGFMFRIVYHGGLRPKLIFFDQVQFLTNIQQNRVWNVYPVFLWLMVFFQAHWGLGPWGWRRDLFLRVLTPMFKKINFGSAASLVDNRRHEAKFRPFGFEASRPWRHVAFLDNP